MEWSQLRIKIVHDTENFQKFIIHNYINLHNSTFINLLIYYADCSTILDFCVYLDRFFSFAIFLF